MTLEEFLQIYNIFTSGPDLSWLEVDCIRDCATGFCPVVLVANRLGGNFNNGQILQASDFLRLSRNDTLTIQLAADGASGRGLKSLRTFLGISFVVPNDVIDTYLWLMNEEK